MQPHTTLSSTEAEYVALCDGCKEGVWVINLIKEIFNWNLTNVLVRIDNKSAIALAKTNMVKPRSKHIKLRYHWIREKVREGLFTLLHVKTSENVADLLTKNLSLPQQHKLLKSLVLISKH